MSAFDRIGPYLALALGLVLSPATAMAAQCGDSAGGFEQWKASFGREAKTNGIGRKGLSALAQTRYSQKTIRADRGQKSFKLSLNQFMKKRGSAAIVSRGRKLKRQYASLFDSIERHYGVPPGPLLAIWGMETGFGSYMGDTPTISAVATLAYDCRRSEFFTMHLYGALQLVDKGMLDPNAVGAAHGEIGHTQFLPANVMKYGVDGDGNRRVDLIRSSADALASTANFLRGHGWRAGAGYGPGETNFRAIQGWNAASVYQQAIAIMAAQIDG